MSRYLNTLGIVIKKNRSRDSDIQITLLTPKHGKIQALAKGAQSIKSSRLSTLQLGNIIKASIYQNKQQNWLSESVTITPFLSTSKSLTQYNLLFYFLEMINRFIAEDQQIEGMFQISQDLIISINSNNFNKFIAQEILLLDNLGFGVPSQIHQTYKENNFAECQKHIKNYIESIIEKPFQSNKLFK
jgi:DNA repair protein RecO (recombination protein O)